MSKKCTICGNKELKTENFCEMCSMMIGALNTKYTVKQIMLMYSHVLGAKIVQEIAENTFSTLKDQYIAERLKEKGGLN